MSDSTKVRLRRAPAKIASDPVVRKVKAGLDVLYGRRLIATVLHGSRARGDARPDSDYDIVAFLKDFDRKNDWSPKLHQLTDELFQEGPPEIEVNILPRDSRALDEQTIFMHNVRTEGFIL